MKSLKISHNPTTNTFTALVPGGEAKIDYTQYGDKYIDYTHTYVPEESREQGVATELAEYAIGYARENGLRVKASCPFMKTVLSYEPDHNALKYPTV